LIVWLRLNSWKSGSLETGRFLMLGKPGDLPPGSAYAFCTCRPGSMCTNSIFRSIPHARNCRLVNSGPLSYRIASGTPRSAPTPGSLSGSQNSCPLLEPSIPACTHRVLHRPPRFFTGAGSMGRGCWARGNAETVMISLL